MCRIYGKNRDGKLAKISDAQEVEGNGGKEGRAIDGRTVLRDTSKESEKNGELQQQLEGTGDYS